MLFLQVRVKLNLFTNDLVDAQAITFFLHAAVLFVEDLVVPIVIHNLHQIR